MENTQKQISSSAFFYQTQDLSLDLPYSFKEYQDRKDIDGKKRNNGCQDFSIKYASSVFELQNQENERSSIEPIYEISELLEPSCSLVKTYQKINQSKNRRQNICQDFSLNFNLQADQISRQGSWQKQKASELLMGHLTLKILSLKNQCMARIEAFSLLWHQQESQSQQIFSKNDEKDIQEDNNLVQTLEVGRRAKDRTQRNKGKKQVLKLKRNSTQNFKSEKMKEVAFSDKLRKKHSQQTYQADTLNIKSKLRAKAQSLKEQIDDQRKSLQSFLRPSFQFDQEWAQRDIPTQKKLCRNQIDQQQQRQESKCKIMRKLSPKHMEFRTKKPISQPYRQKRHYLAVRTNLYQLPIQSDFIQQKNMFEHEKMNKFYHLKPSSLNVNQTYEQQQRSCPLNISNLIKNPLLKQRKFNPIEQYYFNDLCQKQQCQQQLKQGQIFHTKENQKIRSMNSVRSQSNIPASMTYSGQTASRRIRNVQQGYFRPKRTSIMINSKPVCISSNIQEQKSPYFKKKIVFSNHQNFNNNINQLSGSFSSKNEHSHFSSVPVTYSSNIPQKSSLLQTSINSQGSYIKIVDSESNSSEFRPKSTSKITFSNISPYNLQVHQNYLTKNPKGQINHSNSQYSSLSKQNSSQQQQFKSFKSGKNKRIDHRSKADYHQERQKQSSKRNQQHSNSNSLMKFYPKKLTTLGSLSQKLILQFKQHNIQRKPNIKVNQNSSEYYQHGDSSNIRKDKFIKIGSKHKKSEKSIARPKSMSAKISITLKK